MNDLPTCSLPLNTYNLQPNISFLASGGPLYLRTVLVPLMAFTVFVAAARRPEGMKFGFDLSTAEADLDPEQDLADQGQEVGKVMQNDETGLHDLCLSCHPCIFPCPCPFPDFSPVCHILFCRLLH